MKKPKKTEEQENDDVYSSENVEDLLEDDEIGAKEAGFMEGYNQKQSTTQRKGKKLFPKD